MQNCERKGSRGRRTSGLNGLPVVSFLTLATIIMAFPAQAQLQARLGGQAFYDPDRDLTWIVDANLSATLNFGIPGISSDGNMNWHKANQWIAALNSSNYLGFSDWRLPQTTQPDPNCSLQDALLGFPTQGL